MNATRLDLFTCAYIEAALWSSADDEGNPLDASLDVDDIHPDTLAQMVADCEDFQASFGAMFSDNPGRAGMDFWLSRNGHGAGFFDSPWVMEDYPLEQLEGESGEAYDFRAGSRPYEVKPYRTVGAFLQAMSKAHGSFDLYLGDDGMIRGN